jgi:hypothetical protein
VGHPVNWFEIVGSDGATLQQFYADLFGWKIDANNPLQYGMVEAEEGGIGGGIGQAQQAAWPPHDLCGRRRSQRLSWQGRAARRRDGDAADRGARIQHHNRALRRSRAMSSA